MHYKEVAADKVQSLLTKIPHEWILTSIPSVEEQRDVDGYINRFIPERERSITEMSASQLLELQQGGKLSAYEIAFAYCHRAALIHQMTNCCTEIFFERAFQSARELDSYLATTGNLKGKLHGIPISLKDQINLPGVTTAMGWIAPHVSPELELKVARKQSTNDISLIAEILQQEGAVFYVKTTVPMAMLGNETSTNMTVTYNSLDRRMSPGGSSGGEGALLAAKGSLIGIGTDIGGSIRIPSLVHGLYGLRGTTNRFPYLDISNSYPNQLCVPSVVGPMARNIDDLILVSEAILSNGLCVRDPKCVPIKWDSGKVTDFKEKIRIGVLKSDGEVLPHPPILNNLEKLESHLLKHNDLFEVTKLKECEMPVKFSDLGNLLLSLYNCDNFEEIKEFCKLSGEPLPKLFTRSFTAPNHMDNVSEFFDKAGLKLRYQRLFDDWLRDLDCFIIPSYSATCWRIGENANISNFYTRALNVLDYTVMTFPVGRVTENDVSYDREFFNESDKKNWNYYNLDDCLGKPVNVQLVCKRYKEEECCKIVKKITELLQH